MRLLDFHPLSGAGMRSSPASRDCSCCRGPEAGLPKKRTPMRRQQNIGSRRRGQGIRVFREHRAECLAMPLEEPCGNASGFVLPAARSSGFARMVPCNNAEPVRTAPTLRATESIALLKPPHVPEDSRPTSSVPCDSTPVRQSARLQARAQQRGRGASSGRSGFRASRSPTLTLERSYPRGKSI